MILNIETTTQVGSVSLAVEGDSWIIKEELETGDHAKNITLFIEEILKISDVKRWEIKAVAVSSGPGSYTGLRIGLSVAKGLCFALNVPLLAVPTLKALCYGVIKNYKLNENDRIIALMDARRMDAYAAVYDYKLNEVKAPYFLTLESDSFDTFIENGGKLYFCGNAAEKFKSSTSKSAFIFTSVKNPSSLLMEKLSYDMYQKGRFEDLAYFEPFYLKPPNITKPKSIL